MKREMMNTIKLSFAIPVIWAAMGAHPVLAERSAQTTFSSAAEASQSLFQAVQGNDEQTITTILGGPTELTYSRDEGQDKADRELFVKKYQEMHRLCREADGSVILYIGAENWPFPIPLVEQNGAWSFDSEAGLREVTFRRIGENELTAIAICHEFVATHKRNGPRPSAANETDISLVSLLAKPASESAGSDPVLFLGYYFKVLPTKSKTKGGFTLIAYPAEYRSSGVMTFIVTGKDAVYEKDLGANTSSLASAMTAFQKDATWRAAHE